jgi:hypothetical protein
MLKRIARTLAVVSALMSMGFHKSLGSSDDRSPAHDQYRVIDDTMSPNGPYALALGLARKNINWKSFYEKLQDDEAGDYLVDPDTNDKIIRNYVVDLKTANVLGMTGGRYFGTRSSYNTDSCDVVWSPDSGIFVQVIHWKWFSYCRAGRISMETKLTGVVDLQNEAENFAYKFLADKKDAAFLKHHRDFAITIESRQWGDGSPDSLKVDNGGLIELKLSGEIPKSVEENSDFEVIEHLRLTNKLGIELIDIRYAH